MASRIYKRSDDGPYWGDYTDATGKRFQRSLRTKDKAVAKQRLREAEMATSTSPRGRKQRLSVAIDHMIGTLVDKAEGTREMYREKGRRIHATMGDPFVSEVSRDMLSGYIKRRLSDEPGHGNASPHTVQKELITIRRALRESHERGILAVMPAMPRHSPKYQPRETWLTPEQFELLAAELEPKRRLWASIAALAGGSFGEVERAEWGRVEFDNNRMLLPGTKRETRRRWVPISPALRHRLEVVPKKERVGCIVEPWSNVRRDLHVAVKNVNRSAEAGCDPRLPLPLVSPNDLRRTFASWLVQNGVPLLTVATLMGHSSTRMVEKVYGKLSKANLDSAIAALPSFGFATVTPVSQNQSPSSLLPPTSVPNGDDVE